MAGNIQFDTVIEPRTAMSVTSIFDPYMVAWPVLV
jgi:hypothetical protein